MMLSEFAEKLNSYRAQHGHELTEVLMDRSDAFDLLIGCSNELTIDKSTIDKFEVAFANGEVRVFGVKIIPVK